MTSATPFLVALLWLAGGGVLSLIGIALTYWALFRDRARGQPRCPRCWYSMIGATGPRCPECGHSVPAEHELHRTRRHWRWGLPGLLLVVAPWSYVGVSRHGQALIQALMPRWKLIEDVQRGEFTIRRYAHRELSRPMQVRVLYQGRVVFELTDENIELGGWGGEGRPRVGIGDDILSSHGTELVLEAYSGGAHCCYTAYILALEPSFGVWPIATIEGAHGPPLFEDLDGDGDAEARIRDWTFAYWNACFAGSPAPEVTLRYKSGRFVVAPDLMWRPAPTEVEFAELVEQVRDAPWDNASAPGGVPPSYWGTMLDLAYAGHIDLARRFAREAWRPDVEGPAAFLEELCEFLGRSCYWPDVLGNWDATSRTACWGD